MTSTGASAGENLRSAAVVGWVGGLYVGLADLLTTQVYSAFSALSLLSGMLKVLIIYGIAGMAGMALIGGWIFALTYDRSRPLRRSTLTAYHIAAFVYLAAALSLAELLQVYLKSTGIRLACVVVIAACAARAALSIARWTQRRIRMNRWVSALMGLCFFGCAVSARIRWQPAPMPGNIEAPPLPARAADAPDRPNIVWIVLDTVRADHLSAYGYRRRTTPEIDRLAKEGTLYENAIAQAPWTFPSHLSMMTGLSPSTAGCCRGDGLWVDRHLDTVPHLLQTAGYSTVALSGNPWNFAPSTGFAKGFGIFRVTYLLRNWSELLLPSLLDELNSTGYGRYAWLDRIRRAFLDIVNPGDTDLGAGDIARRADAYLELFKTQNRQPFFLFVNLIEAHPPYGTSRNAGRFLPEIGMDLPQAAMRADPNYARLFRLWIKSEQLSPADKQAYNALYDGDLSYLDEKIGALAQSLRNKGLLDKTVLIITSDHGEDLGEDNLFGHGHDLSNRALHVPLIVRYPPAFEPGRRVPGIVRLTDLFPTVLDLARVEGHRERLDGQSLLRPKAGPSYAVSELHRRLMWHTYPSVQTLMNRLDLADREHMIVGDLWSVYEGSYHLIVTREAEHLYDVRQDPLETNDLRRSQSMRAEHLKQVLADWKQKQDPYWGPRFERSGS